MDMLPQPGILFTLAAFAGVIGILVFVHEWGHYAVGRFFGVKAESFSIGFGPELFGWSDKRGTRWKLSALPLGGYVKFAGDMNPASQPDPALAALPAHERAQLFQFKPLWQKAAIVAAGPVINFLFAVLIFAAFFMTWGQQYTPPVVAGVAPNSAAAAAGLQTGDRIVEIGGDRIERFEDMAQAIRINPGRPVDAVIERGGATLTLTVTPRVVEAQDRFGNRHQLGQLGVSSGRPVVEKRGPIAAIGHAVDEVWFITKLMADGLWQVVTGLRPVSELGGPIKIAQFSGQSASLGLPAFVTFIALISINLGFINLLPIPMLDGGHLLLYAMEGVRRRPLNPKVQEWAFMSGFALLMSLMLFLTWHDLAGIGVWDRLAGLFG